MEIIHVNDGLTQDKLNEMENRRLERISEAGINELQILGDAKENLNVWNSYFNENIVRGKDDLNFVIRDQWTAIERSEFTRLFKPAMTFNKLYDPVKKIAAEQRKNKPDLLVRSLTGKATQEQINLRADLVRTISYQSQNDLVYQTAFRSALMMGFGAFQICVDFESPMSFDQIIKFIAINDATRCVFDPTAVKPHKGDGNFCARNYPISKKQFYATFPYITNPTSYSDPYYLLDFQWETKDTLVLCDYFVKEWYPFLLLKLSNGESVSEAQWENMQPDLVLKRELARTSQVGGEVIKSEIPRVVGERQSQDYRIMHYQLIQNQIVDFTEWPSKQLPIVFLDGDSYFIEGRQYTKSYIHEARDSQKFINFIGSEIAAEIKNRRREQWLVTPDNIKGYEQEWRNPELQMGALRAQPDPKTSMMPQKMPPWDLSPAMLQHFMRGSQDIREIMGFSEQDQLQGKDISGKARRERKLEGSMSAGVFFDNLNQSIEQAGRVVLDLLPAVYGGDERHIIISKKDGKTSSLILNKEMPNGEIQNELKAGDYDVEIDTGPSFAVQKEVALEFLQQTLQAFPQAFPLVADLWAKNLDVQFMPQMAERFQTMVPPDILAKESGEQPKPKPPSPQDQMMQMEMQAKQAELAEKQANIEIKKAELELKREQSKLDQAELLLKAQKIQMDGELDVYNHQANIEQARITHHLDNKRTEQDFSVKIAKIMADLSKGSEKTEKKKEK